MTGEMHATVAAPMLDTRDATGCALEPGGGERDDAARRPTVVLLSRDSRMRDRLHSFLSELCVELRTSGDGHAGSHRQNGSNGPVCLVLDAQSLGLRGLALQRALTERDRVHPVIVLTPSADVPSAVAAMKAGAFDVVERPQFGPQSLERIREALAQDHQTHTARAEHDEITERYARLTPREREVLEQVVTGAKSATIAARLGIRPKTIEVYRSRINRKMRTHNAAGLARLLARIGTRVPGATPAPPRTDERLTAEAEE